MTGADEGDARLAAGDAPRPPTPCSGVVAGLRLQAERELSGCGEGEPVAGRLTVRAADAGAPAAGFVEAPDEHGRAWLRLDGRLLLLARGGDWGARVRRLVPYASWLQGLPLLHAAAVEAGGAALALIGGSGIGKSTLAELLSRHGHRVLCDDLTPCRPRGESYVVPRSSRSAVALATLVFLARGRESRPASEPLTRASAVRRLARNGWGDLALSDLWRAQFGFYTGLAVRVPAVRLLMPDDPSRLEESAASAAAVLTRV